MGATAADVMKKASSYIGTKESPANSNNVAFNTHYYGKAVSGADYPWCCVFIWDVFRMVGASDLFLGGNKTAYCPTYETWALSSGLEVSKNAGEYGDVATMDFGKGRASHIGFILARLSDGTYQTIEGNTSASSDDNGGAVMVRIRSKSVIRHIFRPRYEMKNYLSKGDTGAAVKTMQTMLIAVGYSCGASGADGQFGNDTDNALRAFQSAEGLTADGCYGTKSKETLERIFNNMSKCTFTQDQWLRENKGVYDMVHKGGYVYSDSQSLPPCADHKISCERLPARALWNLGMTDQRKGGEVISTFVAWFNAHGFQKITDRNKLQGGDIVFVDDPAHQPTPYWKWHVFVITSYESKTGLCYKYDMGDNWRFKANQPFHVQLEEWGKDRKFKFAYRPPYVREKGPLDGTYVIESAVNRKFCLDAQKEALNIQLWRKGPNAQQKFVLEYVKDGYYRIKCAKSGKMIDVYGAKVANKTNIWQYPWNATKAQLWKPEKNSDGSYTFVSALNKLYVLDLSGGKAENARNVWLYKSNGTAAQKWHLVKL